MMKSEIVERAFGDRSKFYRIRLVLEECIPVTDKIVSTNKIGSSSIEFFDDRAWAAAMFDALITQIKEV